ncbi:hypothetical protein C9374_004017 [Naegleria lovaniensis]|uniref:RRM domain-containing protein n=1 Tax=Naegleria lovaniensis TaxID=51637 RepID=A0AA88KQH9_NAELO|nr:uncharacterized protein C9374_004017 [Naegleria lovaniensis]KAG2394253.1 hypothetical protein C9374_004017 [Naegleria lovaniensis]
MSSSSNNHDSAKRTVYVSNIAPVVNEETLQKFFNFCGEIEMMRSINSSSETKYEIVFFEEASAQKAMKLNGTPMVGFKLQIVGAAPPTTLSTTTPTTTTTHQGVAAGLLLEASQESSAKALNPFIQQIGDPNVDNNLVYSTGDVEKDKEIARTVYVGNIDSRANHNDLVDIFSVCGPIAYIRMAGDGKHPSRFAFIEFLDVEAANKAMALSGHHLLDHEIKVNRSKKPITKPGVKMTPQEEKKLSDAIANLKDKLELSEKDPELFKKTYLENQEHGKTMHNYAPRRHHYQPYHQQQQQYHYGGHHQYSHHHSSHNYYNRPHQSQQGYYTSNRYYNNQSGRYGASSGSTYSGGSREDIPKHSTDNNDNRSSQSNYGSSSSYSSQRESYGGRRLDSQYSEQR